MKINLKNIAQTLCFTKFYKKRNLVDEKNQAIDQKSLKFYSQK